MRSKKLSCLNRLSCISEYDDDGDQVQNIEDESDDEGDYDEVLTQGEAYKRIMLTKLRIMAVVKRMTKEKRMMKEMMTMMKKMMRM